MSYVEAANAVPPGDTVRFSGLAWSPGQVVSFPLLEIDDSSIVALLGLGGFGTSTLTLHRAGGRTLVLGTVGPNDDISGAAVSPDGSTIAWSTRHGTRTMIRAASTTTGDPLATTTLPAGSSARVIGFTGTHWIVVGVRRLASAGNAEVAYSWATDGGPLEPVLPHLTYPARSDISDFEETSQLVLIASRDGSTSCVDAYTLITIVHRWRSCFASNAVHPARFNATGSAVAVTARVDGLPAIEILAAADGHLISQRRFRLPAGGHLLDQPLWETPDTVLLRYTTSTGLGAIRCDDKLDDCEQALEPGDPNVSFVGGRPGQTSLSNEH